MSEIVTATNTKRRCDSDANDEEEEQQEEDISCTNAPLFAAREHASSLT
jgi:hypothetical protein